MERERQRERTFRAQDIIKNSRNRPLEGEELTELADIIQLEVDYIDSVLNCKRLQQDNKKEWGRLALRPSLYLTAEEKAVRKRARLVKAKDRCLKLAVQNVGFFEPYSQSRFPYGPNWIPRNQIPQAVYEGGVGPVNIEELYPAIPVPQYPRHLKLLVILLQTRLTNKTLVLLPL